MLYWLKVESRSPTTTRPGGARRRAGGRKRRVRDPIIAARIRALREASGLTQAQLAGDSYTKGFISLLETGRVALSLPAAVNLAPRLGVSVAELIATGEQRAPGPSELDLVRGEAAFAAGRYEEAARLAEEVGPVAGSLRGRLLRLRGRILVQTDHTAEAVRFLTDAITVFREVRDKELAARTLFDLAQAFARLDAHGEAIHHALLCEAAVYAGDVTDRSLELRLASLLASLFVTIGDLTSADLRIERANTIAEDVTDPRALGNLYACLAIARQREGDLESALHFAKRSLSSYEQLEVPAHIGNMWNTVGWIYVGRGQYERAEDALDRAERIARTTADDRLLAYVIQNRAELALARGRAADAVQLARASATHPGASKRGTAISLLVLAKALARSGAPLRELERAFDDAAKALRPHGKAQEARAHQAHFQALMERGRQGDAARVAQRTFELLSPSTP